jgi:hypothetical protein
MGSCGGAEMPAWLKDIPTFISIAGTVVVLLSAFLAYAGFAGFKCDLPAVLRFGGMHERNRLMIEGKIELNNWARWSVWVDRLTIWIRPENGHSTKLIEIPWEWFTSDTNPNPPGNRPDAHSSALAPAASFTLEERKTDSKDIRFFIDNNDLPAGMYRIWVSGQWRNFFGGTRTTDSKIYRLNIEQRDIDFMKAQPSVRPRSLTFRRENRREGLTYQSTLPRPRGSDV